MFEKLINNNVNNIKEFIASYIESYQECINTSNPDFNLEIVKSNDTIQEEILKAVNIKKHKNYYKPEIVLSSTEMPIFPIPDKMAKTERLTIIRIQMLNQLLLGINNQKESQELSSQIKLHAYLS